VVKPASKKCIAHYLITTYQFSERTACRLAGISRTAYRYVKRSKSDQEIRHRLKELAAQYPRYGYLLLHGLLKAENLVKNKKKTYRIYTEEGLQVRTKKRKKIQRLRIAIELPTRANQHWSMDFVSDQLANGRRFRVLNVVDNYTREMVGQLISVSISGGCS